MSGKEYTKHIRFCYLHPRIRPSALRCFSEITRGLERREVTTVPPAMIWVVRKKYVPFGIINEDEGALYLTFGGSFKTGDFIAGSLMGWWKNTSAHDRAAIAHIQIKVDNGPESSGVRTQFLKYMVEFAGHTSKIVQLLYYPPLTTASTIQLSVAGAFWSSIGMAPSW